MKITIKFCFYASILAVSSLLCSCTPKEKMNPEEIVSILYGNVITMKTETDRAKAVVCKNGQIIYVGSRAEAEKYKTSSSRVLDYGDNFIYPGFMDAHVPVIIETSDGHSVWVNTKAIEKFNINEWTSRYSSDQLRVDKDGVTGYISETPALYLGGKTMPTREEMRTGLLEWQDYAFSKGLTAVSDALVSAGTVDPDIYVDLATDPDKPWKLRTYASYIIDENTPGDVPSLDKKFGEIDTYKANDSEYFKIIGIKLFMDGVVEARTGWLLTPYARQTGEKEDYYGLKRITDRERKVVP